MYSPLALKGIVLPPAHFNSWLLFVEACQILTSRSNRMNACIQVLKQSGRKYKVDSQILHSQWFRQLLSFLTTFTFIVCHVEINRPCSDM